MLFSSFLNSFSLSKMSSLLSLGLRSKSTYATVSNLRGRKLYTYRFRALILDSSLFNFSLNLLIWSFAISTILFRYSSPTNISPFSPRRTSILSVDLISTISFLLLMLFMLEYLNPQETAKFTSFTASSRVLAPTWRMGLLTRNHSCPLLCFLMASKTS
ncbi:158aa long hypothetical protein [Pyrococcus horikoshii OT3]|uniref:Uncharacterized protein n=1 Tax=Pyrococcus horikoshii (strain ATCC 700860 / DSM 12428 / JCM 9974 / NBRC 100139 / OT-3) TaxID=70601 RepID=O58795_PYRHO|nr:158aa long hypothetical protein [Pyrococcus horikoshii OT3]